MSRLSKVDLAQLILNVLSEQQFPIRARDIASILRKQGYHYIDRSMVNSCLYGILREQVLQNDNWEWSIRITPSFELSNVLPHQNLSVQADLPKDCKLVFSLYEAKNATLRKTLNPSYLTRLSQIDQLINSSPNQTMVVKMLGYAFGQNRERYLEYLNQKTAMIEQNPTGEAAKNIWNQVM